MPDVKNGTGGVLAQQFATTAAAYLYGPVAGNNAQMEVRGLVFSNESASAVTVTYGVGKSGATLGAAGTTSGKTVALGAAGAVTAIADATELEDFVLGAGDYVWALASANTSVACTLSGVVY